jgi:hypothetical protein
MGERSNETNTRMTERERSDHDWEVLELTYELAEIARMLPETWRASITRDGQLLIEPRPENPPETP